MTIPSKLTLIPRLSRLIAVQVFTIWCLFSSAAMAHEVRPAVADVAVTSETVEMTIRMSAEAMLAGIDLSGIQDTDEAPEASAYDALRALPASELEARFTAAWDDLKTGFNVTSGTPIDLTLSSVQVGPVGDIELARDTGLIITGALPAGNDPVTVGWTSAYGPLVVRQGDGDAAYSAYLTGGALSEALPRDGIAQESATSAFLRYIVIGFEHIIPKGLDHILFVLGLFFFSLKMRPLLLQITAFTLAHTVTLALATMGLVTVSPGIVEPLIAASITYVAIENVFRPKLGWWRTAVVFGFGLLHGLGFASVLGDIGLEPARFVSGLIAFNIGVEIGQLAVIAAAFLLVGLWFGKKSWYRSRIAIPASIAIALVGAYWFVERVFF